MTCLGAAQTASQWAIASKHVSRQDWWRMHGIKANLPVKATKIENLHSSHDHAVNEMVKNILEAGLLVQSCPHDTTCNKPKEDCNVVA